MAPELSTVSTNVGFPNRVCSTRSCRNDFGIFFAANSLNKCAARGRCLFPTWSSRRSKLHESGHSYFAQTGHSHFAATRSLSSLTCLLPQPKMCANGGNRISNRPNHLALSNCREARWRGHGRRVQGRRHHLAPVRGTEVPAG